MKAPTLEQMSELYIAITDDIPKDEMDNEIMEARQEAFQILINSGSHAETNR